jgi:hypothetical protein
MSESLTQVGHSLDSLLDRLGVPGVHGFEAALYIFSAFILLWVCYAIPAAIRTAQLAGTPRKQRRHSMTTAAVAHEWGTYEDRL